MMEGPTITRVGISFAHLVQWVSTTTGETVTAKKRQAASEVSDVDVTCNVIDSQVDFSNLDIYSEVDAHGIMHTYTDTSSNDSSAFFLPGLPFRRVAGDYVEVNPIDWSKVWKEGKGLYTPIEYGTFGDPVYLNTLELSSSFDVIENSVRNRRESDALLKVNSRNWEVGTQILSNGRSMFELYKGRYLSERIEPVPLLKFLEDMGFRNLSPEQPMECFQIPRVNSLVPINISKFEKFEYASSSRFVAESRRLRIMQAQAAKLN